MQIKTLDQLSSHVYQVVGTLAVENQSAGNDVTPVLVGLSGGRDSTVLLHLLSSLRARLENVNICAIHVNHGIHEKSDEWAQSCQQLCDTLNITLKVSRHQLENVKSNREARYRKLRYQVFRDYLPKNGLLVTAHHQGDQAETILFNLFRGAGLRGLGAMKQCMAFGEGKHVRPLLAVPHQLVCDYAQRHGLSWIDDPSNEDIELDRNYIRHRIMPVIARRWPVVEASISRSGANLNQSEQIVDEIAVEDIKHCMRQDHDGVIAGAYLGVLNLKRVRRLSSARQRNGLRHWIADNTELNITADQLEQISRDLCGQSKSGLFELGGFQIRVYKDSMYLMQSLPQPGRRIEKPIIDKGSYIFEDLGLTLHVKGGITLAENIMRDSGIRFAHRTGGEKIRFKGQTKQLKTLYQHYSIPTWERDIIPLVFQNDRLVAVPGIVLADDSPFVEIAVSKYDGSLYLSAEI